MTVNQFEREFKIHFKNKKILAEAFTHSSYVNEQGRKNLQDNERLEFLGDAVLELAVSKYIYENYQGMSEGEMSRLRANLVCEPSLASIAQQLQLNRFLRLGKGEEQTGGRDRPSILADCFEAILGAIYLDQDLDVAEQFLKDYVFPIMNLEKHLNTLDYKSQLQELIQKHIGSVTTYKIVSAEGPAHNRKFMAEVTIGDLLKTRGKGSSKKEAEQEAAKHALKQIEIVKGKIRLRQV